MEQTPSGFNPPQEPDNGLLLKMTPMAIPAIAMAKTVIPRTISIPKINGKKSFKTDVIIFDQGSILRENQCNFRASIKLILNHHET